MAEGITRNLIANGAVDHIELTLLEFNCAFRGLPRR